MAAARVTFKKARAATGPLWGGNGFGTTSCAADWEVVIDGTTVGRLSNGVVEYMERGTAELRTLDGACAWRWPYGVGVRKAKAEVAADPDRFVRKLAWKKARQAAKAGLTDS